MTIGGSLGQTVCNGKAVHLEQRSRAGPELGGRSARTAGELGRDAGQSLVDEADDHRAFADRGGAALH
jgi:hypothetical protein